MWGGSPIRTVLLGTAFAVFVVSSVLPLAFMTTMLVSNGNAGAFSALLLDERQRRLFFNTIVLGLSTATLATIIGMPLGFALARINLPWKRTLRVLLAAPMLLPPYVAALAWVSLGGGAGLLAQWVGHDVLSTWTYSMPGAIVVLALVFYPVSMLITEVAVRRIEPHLEEAALLVTSPSGVLRQITLRLATPSIAAAALVIFVLAISEFGVPGLLGVRVFTTEVFTAFAALYDFRRATVTAVPLLVLSMVVASAAAAMGSARLVTTRRGPPAHVPLLLGWTRVGIGTAVAVLIFALVVPLALLAREASGVRADSAIAEGSSEAIVNSLVLAALAATIATVAGLLIGYSSVRTSARIGILTSLVFVVLFAVPGTITGIGLIALWNRPGAVGAVYGTSAMLLLAYLARFLPLAALGMSAAVRHVPQAHEEAAATAGASWVQTMTHIIVPQVFTGFVVMWVIVFVLAFGELGASILVAPPGETTLPIRIYTLIANAPPAQVAALALLQAVVTLVPLLILALTAGVRRQR